MQTPAEPYLEWAYRALDSYLHDTGIPEDDLDVFSKEQITVALLGATQQGKTSLALRLLGARPEQIQGLDKALGGGAPTGRSRTRSTTVLTTVDGSNFDKDLECISRIVREQDCSSGQELSLPLPLGSGQSVGITRVIDLVGLESRSESQERKNFIEAQTLKWLQRADLKLVVVRASAITDIVVGKDSWAYKKSLRDLFGYWAIDPQTSFIAVTFAWEDTKQEVIEGKTLDEIIMDATPQELFTITQKHLRKILLDEFMKERGSLDQEFPNVTILPFSLPPEIDLSNPVKAKIYHATELSFQTIWERVSSQKPLVFKIKSAFSHPRKLEAEVSRELENLESIDRLLMGEKQRGGQQEKAKREQIELQRHDLEHIKLLKKATDGIPAFVEDTIRKTVTNSKLALPSISELRDISEWSLFGGHKKSMKGNICGFLSHHLERILSSVHGVLHDLRNQKYDEIPDSIVDKLPFNEIASLVEKALHRLVPELEWSKVEAAIPDNWHKDDGWPTAKAMLRRYFDRILSKTQNSINKSIETLLTGDDLFGIEELYRNEKALERHLSDLESDLDRFMTILNESIQSLEKRQDKSREDMQVLRKRLDSSRSYKRYLNTCFLDYWNRMVDHINHPRKGVVPVSILGELVAATELFSEIAEFSTQESKSNPIHT